ncbi:MAG TPA: rod shape-determining protein MreC [Rhizomicrobium sp.]|nr:rod shape-determining protein MreC [Rhizomicrobium sp.]
MANAWKIARKSNVQLPLVIVIALAVVLVLLGRAQGTLFDTARTHVTDLMAPVLETVRAPVAGFDRWIGSIGEIFSVYQQNLKLKEENARLKQWRNVAIVLQGRVSRYQALLHAVPDPKMNRVLSRVIGRANRPFLQTMVLDAGRDNRVSPGQAVMDARGMIGRVYLTGRRTSWVILLTDLNSRIPVTITASSGKTGHVQAIMTGDNTAMPALAMVSRTVTLQAGDQVTSSGDGGLLPAGLPIGTVMADGGVKWRVALLADAAASQDVEILNFSQRPEALPATAELPAEAAGLKPHVPPPPAPQPDPLAAPHAMQQAAPVPATPAAAAQTPKPVILASPQRGTAAADAAPEQDADR